MFFGTEILISKIGIGVGEVALLFFGGVFGRLEVQSFL